MKNIGETARRCGAGLLLAVAALLLAAGQPARAEGGLSSGVIRIIVLTAPGGATDVVARVIGNQLSTTLSTPLIVEDRAGGFLGPGLREAENAPPDGHTMVLITSSILTQQLSHPEIKHDLIAGFSPITEVATGPLILVVRKGLPVKSLADLLAYAKHGKVTFALGGVTSVFDFATSLLQQRTGMNLVKVPYANAGPALNDVLGGHVDAMFDVLPAEVGQVQQGNVTGLLVTSARRTDVLPDVPTAAEAGLPNFEVASWFGLIGPQHMPPAIAQQLRDEVAKALVAPDVVKQLANQGVTAVGSQPAAWGATLVADRTLWAKVLATSRKPAK